MLAICFCLAPRCEKNSEGYLLCSQLILSLWARCSWPWPTQGMGVVWAVSEQFHPKVAQTQDCGAPWVFMSSLGLLLSPLIPCSSSSYCIMSFPFLRWPSLLPVQGQNKAAWPKALLCIFPFQVHQTFFQVLESSHPVFLLLAKTLPLVDTHPEATYWPELPSIAPARLSWVIWISFHVTQLFLF